MEQLKELIQKIPITVVTALALVYMGFDYYSFFSAPDSPLVITQNRIRNLNTQIAATKAEIKKAEEFEKTAAAKREEIRQLAIRLNEQKAQLSEDVDVASFIKTAVTEAKKVGLKVLGIKPSSRVSEEFYSSQSFTMKYKGVYGQVVVFLERLANLRNIVRVDEFRIKPSGKQSSKYIEVEGNVIIKTFRYNNSAADEQARKLSEKSS